MFKRLRAVYYYLVTIYLISVAITLLDGALNILLYNRLGRIQGFIDGLNFFAEDGVVNFFLTLIISSVILLVVLLSIVFFRRRFRFSVFPWPFIFGTSAAILAVFILTAQLHLVVLEGTYRTETKIITLLLISTIPFCAFIFTLLGRLIIKRFTGRRFRIVANTMVAIGTTLIIVGFLSHVKRQSDISNLPDEAPNVLIIVIDALRRDHISYYGNGFVNTPNLDKFASKSVVFTDAYANAPWTIPSMYTMYTSRYPTVHGADYTHRGSEKLVTLSEVLRGDGYETEAYLATPMLGFEVGLDRGFDRYVMHEDILPLIWFKRSLVYLLMRRYKSFDNWTGRADTTGWLTNILCDRLKTKRNRPFFIWAHYIDPHGPLKPPIKYALDKSPFKEKGKAFTQKRIKRRIRYTKANKDMLISLYRAEVEYVDDSLGEVFRTLEEEGLLNNTLVIITADHGEEHFEHGRYGHTKTHYTEVMAIPLFIRAPEVPPAVCDYPVSLVDLMPTVLSYTGAGIPDKVSGRDILCSVGTESAKFEKSVVFFDQTGECNPILKSIYVSPYILSRRGNKEYQYEFIDTRRIKEAPEDIIEDPPAELFVQYKTALDEWVKVIEEEAAAVERSEEVKLSASKREQLKAFGYF